MNEMLTPITTAVLGFLGGLLTPWIKGRVDAKKRLDSSHRELIQQWRDSIDSADFNDEWNTYRFGNSPEYSSLRSQMEGSVITKFEAARTFYVGGGRGDDVRKQMLLDEVARLEKKWELV